MQFFSSAISHTCTQKGQPADAIPTSICGPQKLPLRNDRAADRAMYLNELTLQTYRVNKGGKRHACVYAYVALLNLLISPLHVITLNTHSSPGAQKHSLSLRSSTPCPRRLWRIIDWAKCRTIMLRTASNTVLDEIPKPLKAVFMTCTTCCICNCQKQVWQQINGKWKLLLAKKKETGFLLMKSVQQLPEIMFPSLMNLRVSNR